MNSSTFVLFDKYCPIVDQLSSKDSSRDFQLNCAISYFFYLHLMLHARAANIRCNRYCSNFLEIGVELNKTSIFKPHFQRVQRKGVDSDKSAHNPGELYLLRLRACLSRSHNLTTEPNPHNRPTDQLHAVIRGLAR